MAGPGSRSSGPAARRRPLGASLPLAERAAALERRVRDFIAAVDLLDDALERYDTADVVDLDQAEAGFVAAVARLRELAGANIGRRPRG